MKTKMMQQQQQTCLMSLILHRVRKKGATLFLPVTLRNANRFSKFFYH